MYYIVREKRRNTRYHKAVKRRYMVRGENKEKQGDVYGENRKRNVVRMEKKERKEI
jgi:hypothetical protein